MTALLIVAAIVTPVALLHRWHREPPPSVVRRCPHCPLELDLHGSSGPGQQARADAWLAAHIAAKHSSARGEVAS